MRYLVLTDIHANLEALDACLSDAQARRYDRTLVLGDLVGYGADPNAVIDCVVRLNPHAIVRGNHDKVACGLEAADGFNTVARSAARWTLDTLTDDHREWLAALPRGPIRVDDLVEICHGSPFDEDAYIFDRARRGEGPSKRRRGLSVSSATRTTPPCSKLANDGLDSVEWPTTRTRCGDARARIEISRQSGSVGQPRDGDPRAACAIVDESTLRVELFRVNYAVNDARTKIVKAGLPEVLAQRLTVGR